MKVIFRSNDQLAKKELGQLGGAEEWLSLLDRYVSDAAIARLSLFIDDGVSLATLDITDGTKQVHSTYKDENSLTALQTVIKKCINQLKKYKQNINCDTLRYNNEYNMTFDSINESVDIFSDMNDDFALIELESKLAKEKETPRYKKTMDKYMQYINRISDVERANEHLRILYSIYNELDKEKTSVADYERLIESINELTDELYLLFSKQECFENNTKDNAYINYIVEEEAKLAKLKK